MALSNFEIGMIKMSQNGLPRTGNPTRKGRKAWPPMRGTIPLRFRSAHGRHQGSSRHLSRSQFEWVSSPSKLLQSWCIALGYIPRFSRFSNCAITRSVGQPTHNQTPRGINGPLTHCSYDVITRGEPTKDITAQAHPRPKRVNCATEQGSNSHRIQCG